MLKMSNRPFLGVLAGSLAVAGAVSGVGALAQPSATADEEAIKGVLSRYAAAVERLAPDGTEALFTPDSQIFESGTSEGTYRHYLAHHLRPELAQFRSFRFSDYQVNVRVRGDFAYASETYRFRIERRQGGAVQRQGVATSVLVRTSEGWRIASMHNSSR